MNKDTGMTGKAFKAPMGAEAGFEGERADGFTPWERDQIKRRACALWYEAGCPRGQDRELWEQAELQVLKARSMHGVG